jgi:hypothetical protein
MTRRRITTLCRIAAFSIVVLVLALAILWDIGEEMPEKGALRSLARGIAFVAMPAFLFVRAMLGEWRASAPPNTEQATIREVE